jgi:imidazolonepropionase
VPILTDISWLAQCRDEGGQAGIQPIENAAIVYRDGVIEWVGAEPDLPAGYATESRVSAGGQAVVPGLIDCHTHLLFGGWRADEFAARLGGKSYLDIAREGGGIRKTVRQTRAASDGALLEHGLRYLRAMRRLGVTAIEAKTGYALSLEQEMRMLYLYRQLNELQEVEIVPTLLAAHIFPDFDECNLAGYISMITDELIPKVAEAGLAEFNDVFVEDTAFTIENARRILEAGRKHGLRPKLHVDQLHDGGGAALAASVHAVSADHLEYTGRAGAEAMAAAGSVAVALPLASLYLKQPPMNARMFVEAGAAVAVATDFNPGSAPSYDLPLALMLSCTMNGLTPAEALKGATLYAARAMGREDVMGSIEPGKHANFTVLEVPDVNHWLYHFRSDACTATFIKGERSHDPAYHHDRRHD